MVFFGCYRLARVCVDLFASSRLSLLCEGLRPPRVNVARLPSYSLFKEPFAKSPYEWVPCLIKSYTQTETDCNNFFRFFVQKIHKTTKNRITKPFFEGKKNPKKPQKPHASMESQNMQEWSPQHASMEKMREPRKPKITCKHDRASEKAETTPNRASMRPCAKNTPTLTPCKNGL